MKEYIVIKEFQGIKVGTKLIPHQIILNSFFSTVEIEPGIPITFILSENEVIKYKEYFMPIEKYREYYSWKNPIYSREEIYRAIEECFPNKRLNEYSKSIECELDELNRKLREIGIEKAKVILDSRDV